ncbi:MAG TPA: thioredoxin domain-containing protein [Thermoanaerobaculia bacterium]|nr:thioredoxin domain-containing protein [Thermoanaerobaculia bacterium]
MKRVVTFCSAALLFASAVLAADAPAPKADPRVERAIKDSLPVCGDAKVSQVELPHALPNRFTGSVVRVESARAGCEEQFVLATSPTGGFFLGVPWFLDGVEGKTIEEKLKAWVWTNMQENVDVNVDRSTRTSDGLFKVTLFQTTPYGKMPMEGEVDADGKVFFFGHFHPLTSDIRTDRTKAFSSFVANAPARGAEKPAVTVIEFSDFQCPSCKHASGYLDSILAKHSDKVRYVRFDLPLVTAHPWAFSAAVAGRAIWRQKPEAFWSYKKQVYESQGELTAFTIDEFARNFAQDHDLDLKQYDADVASETIRAEILKGVGAAFVNDVRATPTYVVNGTLVDPGDNGAALAAYVEKLLAD